MESVLRLSFYQRYNRIRVLRVTRSFHNKVTLCDFRVYTLLLYIGELVLTMKIHDNTTQETQKYRNLTIVIIKHILEILIDW